VESAGNPNNGVVRKTGSTSSDILRKHLLPAFGRLKLDQIDAARIETFKAQKVKEGLSKKSVNNLLTVLRKLLALAQEFGELSTVPKVVWLKAPKPEIDFLSFEEADQMESHAEPGRWKTMIILALNTGLRIGELAALSWDCVDMANGRLVVKRNVYRGQLGTPKGGREREVPLNDRALKALREYPRRLNSSWVFPQRDGGFIRNPQHTCAEAILRNAERAGIRPIGWHTLRHTFASHLVMSGVPLKAVQELMGHATIEMTMRYAHLSPNVKKDAVKALDMRPRGTYGAHSQEATPRN
jgi:integrase